MLWERTFTVPTPHVGLAGPGPCRNYMISLSSQFESVIKTCPCDPIVFTLVKPCKVVLNCWDDFIGLYKLPSALSFFFSAFVCVIFAFYLFCLFLFNINLNPFFAELCHIHNSTPHTLALFCFFQLFLLSYC